jgi:hypothetical protein
MMYPGAPRIMFAPDDGTGTGTNDDAATAAAAAAKVAEEAAAKAAADKAAADLAAAEEAARKSQDGTKDDTSKEKADLLREVMEKKTKLREAEAAREALQNELNKFQGIDLDEVRNLLKEKADREKKDAEDRGEFDRVKQMMADEHKKQIETLQAQIEQMSTVTKSKDTVIDQLTIGNAFSGSQFIATELTLPPTKARALYGSHFEVVDGKVVAYDKPAGAADRTPLVDGNGVNLSFEAAFKKIVDQDADRETLYRAKIAPGAQSKSSGESKDKKADDKGLFGVKRIAATLGK